MDVKGCGGAENEPSEGGLRADQPRFDRFTDRARKVLTLAQEEAQRLNDNHIDTEHLLLGLVRQADGVAAKVLSSLGVERHKVRRAVELIIGRCERTASGEIGLAPRANRVIELAVDEERRLGHHYIGTEHLLLGLIREGEGIAAGVLDSLGLNLERVRTEVVSILTQTGSMPHVATAAPHRQLTAPVAMGHGYDIHRLVPDRKLILGGVVLDHPLGLEGHSDADVLLHAIMDALLGAAGLGDIGHYFPNTEDKWNDASSLVLLEDVHIMIRYDGWTVGNIDATVIAEAPKIAAHIPRMRRKIASRLGIESSQINIKATTAEGAGPEGRQEAISAHAVTVLIRR